MFLRLRVRGVSRRHFSGRRATQERGAQILEAALVLPILLTLLIGIVWVGRAYNVYQTITRAAREGARVGVAPSCGACGNTYPSSSEIQTAVDNVLSAASLDPATAIITIQPDRPTGQVAVQVNYPFQFVVPFTSLNLTRITITASATMRRE